jgi:hypothetical protein
MGIYNNHADPLPVMVVQGNGLGGSIVGSGWQNVVLTADASVFAIMQTSRSLISANLYPAPTAPTRL